MKKNDVVKMLQPGRGDINKFTKIATVKFNNYKNIRFKLKLQRDRFFWFKGTVGIDIKYKNNNMEINYAWEGVQYPTILESPEDLYSIRFEKVSSNTVNIYYRYVSGLEEGKFISLNDCNEVTLYSNQPILTKISDLNIKPLDFLPNESIGEINLNEIHERGVTGKGIKVAVIDNALVKPNNKLDIKSNYSIDDRILYGDHATACASIIKSREFGIAPDCELYSLSTNDNTVSIEASKKVADCIKWCVNKGIDIVSISLGIGEEAHLSELEEACMYAYSKGVIIVAGAGNNGNEKNDDMFDIKIPGSYAHTICVSNVDRSTGKISEVSSRGYGIDFAGYGDGNKAYNTKGETYLFKGTSSATPYIAGCIALIKQQLPQLNMLEVYDILKENAIKIDNNIKSTKYGYGLIKPMLIPKDYKYKNRDFLEAKESLKNIYFEDIVLNISEGKTFKPAIKFYPNNESSFVSFSSSNSDIVSVKSQNNIAKAIKEGSATITAILRNGQKAQVKVNVIPSPISDEENRETLKELGVYDVWKKGFKGEGIKVGYIGWGCIDTDKIRIKERYTVHDSVDKKECGEGLGTQVSSLISGQGVGIAPNCEYYVLNPCFNITGMGSLNDIHKCADWALSKKLDIVFIRNLEFTFPPNKTYPSSFDVCKPENVKKLIQNMHDNGIIVVTIIDEDASNPTSSLTNTENTLTISYVTDKKEYPNSGNKKPMESKWIDCVGFGYGMNVINVSEKEVKITDSNINDIWDGEYYAASQICGILALLKQQNPNLKTAQDVRAILPKICEPLYGGKNNKTGYGLLKAKL